MQNEPAKSSPADKMVPVQKKGKKKKKVAEKKLDT